MKTEGTVKGAVWRRAASSGYVSIYGTGWTEHIAGDRVAPVIRALKAASKRVVGYRVKDYEGDYLRAIGNDFGWWWNVTPPTMTREDAEQLRDRARAGGCVCRIVRVVR